MAEILCPSCGSGFQLIGDEALAYHSLGARRTAGRRSGTSS
jgi:hypothetical protein